MAWLALISVHADLPANLGFAAAYAVVGTMEEMLSRAYGEDYALLAKLMLARTHAQKISGKMRARRAPFLFVK